MIRLLVLAAIFCQAAFIASDDIDTDQEEVEDDNLERKITFANAETRSGNIEMTLGEINEIFDKKNADLENPRKGNSKDDTDEEEPKDTHRKLFDVKPNESDDSTRTSRPLDQAFLQTSIDAYTSFLILAFPGTRMLSLKETKLLINPSILKPRFRKKCIPKI